MDMLMFISFGFIRRGTLCYSGVFWMDYIILVCLGGLYDTGVFWLDILVCLDGIRVSAKVRVLLIGVNMNIK